MATQVLTAADRFPAGTSVSAYAASNWGPTALPPSGAPLGSSAATAVVAANGSVTFTGLADDTRYYAYALVSSEHRYVAFRTPPVVASGSLPAGGDVGDVVTNTGPGAGAWSPPVESSSGIYVQEASPAEGDTAWLWLPTNASGVWDGTFHAYATLTPAAPANTAAPVLFGTAVTGETLSCSTGTWTGYPGPSYTYQWKRAGVAISGATASTHLLVVADEGVSITCTVTATNATGSASATSNAVIPDAVPTAPANTVAPAISGTPTVGQTLTCSTGTWTGTATITYAYQWKRAGANISGATASSYALVAADAGVLVKCAVTATNSVGSASADSNSVTPAATVPGAPTSLNATAGDAQVVLTWTAPASNGGSAITDYIVEKSPAGAGTWTTFADGTSATTGATVTGLTNGTAYDFRVSTVNAVGTGVPSSTASATPASAGVTAYGMGNVELWLKPEALSALADNDPVSSWPDSSGLARHATATGTTRPLYKTGAQNGLAGVRFDGTDDQLILPTMNPGTPCTLYLVIKRSDIALKTYFDSAPSTANTIRSPGAGSTDWDWHNGGGITGITGQFAGTAMCLAVRHTTAPARATRLLRDLNVFTNTNASTAGVAWTAPRIGSLNTSSQFFLGDVHEVVIYSAAHSDAEMVTVATALKAKWGTP